MKKLLPFITIFSLIISVYPLWLWGEARSFELGIKNQESGDNNLTIEQYSNITILNPHSSPAAGDSWEVRFETKGVGDLTITPIDQPTIDDLEFVSLKCGEEKRNPKILEGDVIFYPGWFCKERSQVTHLVNVAGDHTLKFQFGGQIAYAYNSPDDTGWKNPSATGEDYNNWLGTYFGPADAFTDDGQYAFGFFLTEQDYYNFSFEVPSGATIDGIEVHVNWTGLGEDGYAGIGIELSWNGGTNYTSTGKTDTTLVDGPSEDDSTFGGPTDTWGRSWSPSEFSNTNFRLKIRAENYPDIPFVDHIEVKVYYTEAANQAPTAPTALYTNNTDAQSCCSNPTNLTDTTPVFSAIYNDPDSGDQANQYRIQVDDNSDFSSPIWDSGTSSMATTTEGNRSPNIEYSGSTLSYNTTYYWRIRFLDDDGVAGAWSTTTSYFKIVSEYEMGSATYRIWQSSINVGGHPVQTSTSYRMSETIGEIATGISTSSSYKLFAGYQQMQEVYLSVALSTSSLQMSPDIPGLTGGTSTAILIATTTTDSPSGYSIYVSASTSPAMKCQSGGCNVATDNFADYTPSTPGTPDFSWQVASNVAEFGFTPEGSHIVQKFKDNGSSCNTGTNDTTDACWYNFSTSNEIIAQSYSANHPSGTPTTIKFQAESGPQNNQTSGNYGAVITITVVSN